MSSGEETGRPSRPGKEVTESLSQFVARVLNQLSLSAWLPSASLVLALLVIFQLAAALDRQDAAAESTTAATSQPSSTATAGVPSPTTPRISPQPGLTVNSTPVGTPSHDASGTPGDADPSQGHGVGAAFTSTVNSIADTDFGGALLLFALVVVLTVLTQAFAFEAIRTLEGYWGTWPPVEAVARLRTRRHEKTAARLRRRLRTEVRHSLKVAARAIAKDQDRARRAGNANADSLKWTTEHLAHMRASAGEYKTRPRISDADRAIANGIPWQHFAGGEELRRQRNLEKRLQDYPEKGRCLPTRLGTLLRKFEDDTEYEPVETFVVKLYDRLPGVLKSQHDDHRNKLELYASMVFVCAAVTAVGVLRLVADHRGSAFALIGIGLVAAWTSYRAAIASGRQYGLILVTIAELFPPGDDGTLEPVTDTASTEQGTT